MFAPTGVRRDEFSAVCCFFPVTLYARRPTLYVPRCHSGCGASCYPAGQPLRRRRRCITPPNRHRPALRIKAVHRAIGGPPRQNPATPKGRKKTQTATPRGAETVGMKGKSKKCGICPEWHFLKRQCGASNCLWWCVV